MKMFIATPCAWEMMHLDTVIWLLETASRAPQVGITEVQFSAYTTPRIMLAHNQAWHAAKHQNADLLLFLDPDMVPAIDLPGERRSFIPSSLQYLRDNPLAVVAAPAVRSGDGQINVFLYDDQGMLCPLSAEQIQSRIATPLFERVAAIGTGLMLIPRGVLYGMPDHPFQDVYDQQNGSLLRSQDVEFCMRAANAGVSVVANWFAPAGHRKLMTLVPTHD